MAEKEPAEDDFWTFKLFITHRLVTFLWSAICSLTLLWLFFGDTPTFWWRLLIALIIIIASRIFFEFGVVLFSIADLLREIRDAVQKTNAQKGD